MGPRAWTIGPTVFSVALLGACAAMGAGCVATAEERPPRIYVTGPPPPALVETRPRPSAPNLVWVDGYWHWNGVQHVWIPGHWESPPAGLVWVPPRYGTMEGRYIYNPGAWRAQPPQGPALAR